MNALILAAGLGTRLGSLTSDRPKALVEVEGRTMLEHQLRHLAAAGFDRFVINIHHFAGKVQEYLKQNGNFGLDITLSDESGLLLDTGGGIRKAMHLFTNDDPVLVHNVDIFSDTDLRSLYQGHIESGADATLLTARRNTSRYLYFDADGKSHLSLPLLGLGEVLYKGRIRQTAEVWKEKGWEPITLQSKEGLALLNGTQFMSAHAVWSILKSMRLARWADLIGAMSLDAYDGRIEPFLPLTHQLRPHMGQILTGKRFIELLEGSELSRRPKEHVQDPYSFRCIPQVHGAVKDNILYVKSVIEAEINSATDNPNIFPDEDMVISAGNFHGEPIAIPMDALAIAMSELASISERRTYQLIHGLRGLPKYLVANPGLNNGFMIPQYTAASIVSQNKGLCWPASCDSIPSSQGQEDHVSMGSNSATKLVRVVDNTETVLGIELFNAAQALDFRLPLKRVQQIRPH